MGERTQDGDSDGGGGGNEGTSGNGDESGNVDMSGDRNWNGMAREGRQEEGSEMRHIGKEAEWKIRHCHSSRGMIFVHRRWL